MLRREFIATVAALGAVSACQTLPGQTTDRHVADLPNVGDQLEGELNALLAWMNVDTPWSAYFSSAFSISLPKSLDRDTVPVLVQAYSSEKVERIRATQGFEDFGGLRLIEPGKPALSFLYFALASPRVRLPHDSNEENYPSLGQLESLENFIYALQPVTDLGIQHRKYTLAVFAYEFRPGPKTPHRQHADMVFSRTGVSRVGTVHHHWNRSERRFSNTPRDSAVQQASPQSAAVTPARYALFLAEIVKSDSAQLIGKNAGDRNHQFLLPVRKIVNGDPILEGRTLVFQQYHRDEKLARLLTIRGLKGQPIRLPAHTAFQTTQPPFLRVTCTSSDGKPLPYTTDNTTGTDQQLVSLVQTGSSVLLEPCPAPLVREATQLINGVRERLRFRVPEFATHLRSELNNRRYTTLKLIENPALEAAAFYTDDILYGEGRKTTTFIAPRNGPTFVNIRYKVSEDDGNTVTHLGPGCEIPEWEKCIQDGGYWAALFQDNLCDGCVTAGLSGKAAKPSVIEELLVTPILPAFSLVSAPDFMELVDGVDLKDYDNHFLEGGTEIVSGARVRANPNLLLPGTDKPAFPLTFSAHEGVAKASAFTVTAVVSGLPIRSGQSVPRDYASTNSLPDTASNVFAPGWDITYSNINADIKSFYFASFGLGSPFPEDMKLCAAANGMWPASSPDAARTFQPSLGEVITSLSGAVLNRWGRRPGTAVPLFDQELGFHPDSAAVKHYKQAPIPGWDGEHGPFLAMESGLSEASKFIINFTDIRRADYVQNIFSQTNQMRIGALQALDTNEIIRRMGALQRCIEKLPHPVFVKNDVRLSKLWLVSAEPVVDWNLGARGYGIPPDLIGSDNGWATASQLGPGARRGMLFIFAENFYNKTSPVGPDSKRSLVGCTSIYVCQLANDSPDPENWRLAWTEIKNVTGNAPRRTGWKRHL
jgi:hypothetical protein